MSTSSNNITTSTTSPHHYDMPNASQPEEPRSCLSVHHHLIILNTFKALKFLLGSSFMQYNRLFAKLSFLIIVNPKREWM
jgi:hypothetical protein